MEVAITEEAHSDAIYRQMLVGLMALFFLMWFIVPLLVPGAARGVYLATLPFRNLGIFVHEMGHGLSTVISGGRFHWFQMEIMRGGVAVTSGGWRIFTLLGGLLGPALFGAILLQISTRARNVEPTLWALIVFFGMGAFFMVRPLFLSRATYPELDRQWSTVYLVGLVIPVLGILLTWIMRGASDLACRFYLQVVGMLMLFSGYSDTRYIFRFEQLDNGLYSDAREFASLFWPGDAGAVPFGLFLVVAVVISVLNFGLMGWGVYRALRKSK